MRAWPDITQEGCKYVGIFVFQARLSRSSLSNPFWLFAVSWHYSWGCFICGNTHETPVSIPYVTTTKVCVYKEMTSYLPFIVHFSFYVRYLNLMLHGWKDRCAIKLEHTPHTKYYTYYSKTLSKSRGSLCNTPSHGSCPVSSGYACLFEDMDDEV